MYIFLLSLAIGMKIHQRQSSLFAWCCVVPLLRMRVTVVLPHFRTLSLLLRLSCGYGTVAQAKRLILHSAAPAAWPFPSTTKPALVASFDR